MQSKSRQEKIINYLRVKPSNHGEIETVLLAIPHREQIEISPNERQVIEDTFKEQGTNLIPIIVRRIEPDENECEYEVVYGQKWCIVAEELGIERLWAWVFDLEDSQIPLVREQMDALAGSQESPSPEPINQNHASSDGLVKAVELNLSPSLVTEVKGVMSDIRGVIADIRAGNLYFNLAIQPTSSTSDSTPDKEYQKCTVRKLRTLAKERGLSGYSDMRKEELIQLHRDYDRRRQG
jgi:hypothetical protein